MNGQAGWELNSTFRQLCYTGSMPRLHHLPLWPLLLVAFVSACQEDPVVDDDSTAPPDDDSTVAPDDDSTAPPDDDSTVAPDDDSTAPSDDDSTAPPDDDSTAPSDDDSTAPPDDDSTASSDDDSTPVDVEEVPGLEDPTDWLYSLEEVFGVDIDLSAESIAALYAEPFEYVVGDITIDGFTVPDVGIRIKGKLGTFRDLSGKPSFRVKFNEYVEGQSFFGLEHLILNNMIVDGSHVHDRLSYQVFSAAGLPACRTGYAWVTVNGADYGLYLDVEAVDDEYLERYYEDPSGNLYDGKYVLYDDWSYQFVDFTYAYQDFFQLDEGTDVALADIHAITDLIATYALTEEWMDGTGTLLDWENLLSMFAGEMWTGQNDGYALNTNNYWVYFNPETALMEMIPWDLDYSFLEDYSWGMDWHHPRGMLARFCMADEACREGWRETSAEVGAAADSLGLEEDLDAVYDLILPYVEADPRREISMPGVNSAREYARAWILGRTAAVAAFWEE